MPLTSGDRLGPYEILAPLGAGGMGEVYRARDSRLGRDVALKILPAEMALDPGRRQRFDQEARAVAALNHPNIMAVYDIGFESGQAFMVSELVQGEPLRALIQRGPVPLRKALDIGVQIADGLAAAHAAQIAHRDLKPENIMISPEGRVKILDFGLAKSMTRAAALSASSPADATRTIASTQPGTILGTVSYMSPEQASGIDTIDGRSDQFSLGLILHELVTGKRAFERPTAAETMTAIIREDPAPLPASLHGPFRWIIDRCLSKEPVQRYDTTRGLFQELRQLREHASEISIAAPAAAPPKKARAASSRLPLALAAGILMGLAFALFWLQPPLSAPTYTPFATEPGIQTMPSWSPAGDRIAYAAEVDGIFQIFTRKIGSSTPTQITHQPVSCFYPFWSPDAARIYFTVNRGDRDQSLWSTGVAGGEPEKVLDNVGIAALSPDGKTLAVAARQSDGTYAFMLSSPPGAPPNLVPQKPISDIRAAFLWQIEFHFTRDGKYLGLMTDARSRAELWKIPTDGSAATELLHGRTLGRFHGMFTWLPDGNMVWSDASAGDSHLFNFNFGNSKIRPVTSGTGEERYQAISPDGRTMAFQSGDAAYDLVEVPLDGAPIRSVLATDRSEVAPNWAPDGIHFVYATDRSGPQEIWLRNRQDGSERLVVKSSDLPNGSGNEQFLDCAISPDGSRVAFRRMYTANVEIWVSSLAGDAPVRLYADPRKTNQRGPSWSPDGNWIAYYSTFENKPAVMKIRVGAGHEPELVTHVSVLNPVRWSPRGDSIAWNDGHNLTLVDPAGKNKRVISQNEWLTYGWSKDSASLYGIVLTDTHHLTLSRVEPGGAEHVITDMGLQPASLELAQFEGDFAFRGFSLHPDGKSFLTSALAIKGDIWLVQDFDRPMGWLDRILHR